MTFSTFYCKIDFINTIGADRRTKWLLFFNTVLLYLHSTSKRIKRLINLDSLTTYNIIINHHSCEIQLRVLDIPIFYEVMMEETYFLPQDWISIDATVVDLGAHVGCTSIYLHQFHKIGTYVALEPSPKNFMVLQQNAITCPMETVNKAIYSKDGKVKIDSSKSQGQNHHLNDAKGTEIDAIHMETLMKEYNIDTIDLLKVDIEGTENILFKNKPDWLKSVRVILIELHGDYTVADLKNDISPYGFEIISSENPYGIKMICAHRML
jgi:FkbM family methyltransferase